MKISDVLSREAIVPELAGGSKVQILEALARALARAHPELPQARLVEVLLEREQLGSTAIGEGIAIPHGKLSDLRQVVAAFGRCPAGAAFDSVDGQPTKLFFLLVAPEDSAGAHLKALARVSRLLRNPEFREKLLESETAESIYEAIHLEDQKY